MDPRETWSKGPTASTERTVARGHASVAARSRQPTASVPVRLLVGHACLLEVGGEMLREHAADETPQHIPDCEGPDPAVWLAQRDKPRDADAVKHGRRHFCIG